MGYRTVLAVPMLREGHGDRRRSRLRAIRSGAFAPSEIDAGADLRRPGGDRDRERAAVQRDQGGARAADRHRAKSCRSSAVRWPTPGRCSKDPRQLPAPVRHRAARHLRSPATTGRCTSARVARRRARSGERDHSRSRSSRLPPALAIAQRRVAALSPTCARRRRCRPACAQVAQRIGDYSIAWAPMLWEDRGVGSIIVLAPAAAAIQPTGMALLQDLRRPGGDRDPERAPVQRNQGSAGAADRHRGGAAGHQQFGGRHAAGVREDPAAAARTCSTVPSKACC